MGNEVSKKQQFLQIKNIFTKIINETDTVEKFKSKTSVEERFNFTKELCAKLNLPCDYNKENFEKFDFLLAIISEINSKPDLLEKFKKINNIDEMANFIDSTVAAFFNGAVPVKIEKEDIEAFVYVSSVEKITPEGENSVAGGAAVGGSAGGADPIITFSNMSRAYISLGEILGRQAAGIYLTSRYRY